MENKEKKILEILHSISENKGFPDKLSCISENIIAFLEKKDVRFRLSEDKVFSVQENAQKQVFTNKRRGFKIYRNGLKNRLDFLLRSYCLHNVVFFEKDVVIDCGANYGDLFLALRSSIDPKNYFAFEPDPDAFNALQKNIPRRSHAMQIALGEKNGDYGFYISSAEADSSLIEPVNWDTKITVPVVRLDAFLDANQINSVKLLKLEAEGSEPEILKGLGEALKKVHYIAIDGGCERGVDCEETFSACANYLIKNGFYLVEVFSPWLRALFEQRKIEVR